VLNKAVDISSNFELHISNIKLYVMVILHRKQASSCDKLIFVSID